MITCLYSANRTIGSRGIQLGTRCGYSHVDVVLPDSRLFGATWKYGVDYQPVRTDYTRRLMVEYDVDQRALDVMFAERGKVYDWRGALGIGFDRDWQDDESWFCDELIEYGCLMVGQPLLHHGVIKPWRITQRDLLLSHRIIRSWPLQ